MSTSLLFEQFATLATAPDGIARLRELILQLAVQGKLGTQDSGDEPAAKLIERIRKEKKQLIADGKIRQEQPIEPIEIGEFQKNLPPKWQLSKLGEYSLIIMGQSPESKYYNEHGSGLPFYQGKSEFGKLFPKPRVWCETPRKIAQKNDILISVRAPVGPTNICPSESCIGRGLTALRSLSETSHFFLLYSLRASEKLIAEMGVGSTFSAISKKDLDNFVIAIPPLAEQHRIVAKVDRLMALCDELEARQQKERTGCLKLGTASLSGLQNAESSEEFERQWGQVCEAFDLILDCPENVEVIRQTILQLAVQGKLGTQDIGDEPAINNLLLMRSEKKSLVKQGLIRNSKDLFPILSNDVQFSVPSNWVWAIIDDIGKNEPNSIVDGPFGSNLLLSDYVENGEYPVISISNIDNGFDRGSVRYISKEKFLSLKRSAVKSGDIIMAKIGSSYGKCGYYPDHLSEGIIPANLLKVTVSEKLNKRYIFLFFKSLFLKQELDLITNITAQPAFGVTNFKRLFIPLPPPAEQHRIVAKVDALMALCDALEARLKERAGMQGRFANAVVKSIANV